MQQASGRAGAILTIDLQALRANYRLLRAKVGAARCGAVVKADAYGVGVARVAPVLFEEGCRDFFVAHLEEGITLRRLVPLDATIYVMHGSPIGYEAELLEHRLTPVLNSMQQIVAWRQLATRQQKALTAMIQIDTGMSRMGLSPQEAQACVRDPELLRGIHVSYLMSHLSCAEAQEHPMNQQQQQAFDALLTQLRSTLVVAGASATLANSSGIFLGAAFHYDLVRPGSALYGVAPVAGQLNPMHPVVYLKGRIIQTRDIAAGIGVGYGLTYHSPSPRRIATVAVGYADGWLRSLSNRGMAMIGEQAAPIVGNVSMDTLTLDVTGIDTAYLYEGALVDLLSSQQTVDDVAKHAGTIGYEILTSLGARYERCYVD